MSRLLEALDRLKAASIAPVGGELGATLDLNRVLRPLTGAIAEMESRVQVTTRPSLSVLEEAKRAWGGSKGRVDTLSMRQIRALCWDPDTATDPQFVAALSLHPSLPQSRRWIEGLIESYVAKWRTMRNPEAVEEVLRISVRRFAGKSSRIEETRAVAKQLFSADAPTWLGEQTIEQQLPIPEALRRWRIEASSGLGEAAANAAVVAWTRSFDRLKASANDGAARQAYAFLTRDVLPSTVLHDGNVAAALSSAILWDVADRDDELREDLKTHLLDRFGDPRLPQRQAGWALFDATARQRAVGWLAKNDLLFFFKYVIRDDPHGRRNFWLRYIDRAVDANVALSGDDAWRLRSEVKERLSYSKTSGGTASAFLMRFRGPFKDILCVEFSETGNALYIHDTDKFIAKNKSIRERYFDVSRQLKNQGTALDRFSHTIQWKWRVEEFLARLGIRR